MNINEFDVHYIDSRKHNDLYERIMKESLKCVSINEGEVKVHTVFMEKDDESVKASLILLNGAPSKINFENIDMVFKNEETDDTITENCDFRFLGIIPSNTITPFELEFNSEDFKDIKCDVSELKAQFNTKMTAHGSVIISNISAGDEVRFEDKVKAKMYLKGMEPMKKNTISIKTFEQYLTEESVIVPMMLLNAYDKDASISGFSVVLKNALGNVSGVKKVENPIDVEGKSATLVNVVFNTSDLKDPIPLYNYCTVSIG